MQDEFADIYNRYSAPLFRFVYRFTGTQEAAEEILHDIFVEYLAGKFSGEPEQLKGWLFTLAKNKSLNHLKKRERQHHPAPAADDRTPEIHLVEQRRNQWFTAVEAALPPELSRTWNLRKQGLEYREIAGRLAIPLGTVKSRMARLVEYFRKELFDEG